MAANIPIAGAWLALFAVYLVSAPGTFYFEDSPELVACAQVLGNTHGPGYPLFMLAGKLAMLIPVGSPAFRINMLSAACGAGAATGLGALVAVLASRFVTKEIALLTGVFAALTWGLSDTFWWQAVIGDKYAAFYLAFVVLAWAGYALAVSDGMRLVRWILLASLASGLALAHHAFSIFSVLIPVFALIGRVRSGAGPSRPMLVRSLLIGLVLAGLAFSSKLLYPPMRSSARVVLDWERTDRLPKLLSYLAAERYFVPEETTLQHNGGGNFLERLLAAGKSISREFPLLLIAITPLGAVKFSRAARGLVPGLICMALLNCVFMLQFPERVSRWQEPVYAVILFFAAGGLAEMAGSFARVGRPRLGVAGSVTIVLLGGLWQWEGAGSRNALSRFYAAHDLGRNILMSLPRDAIYLGRGDTDLFPLWAMLFVEGARPDVAVAGLGSVVDINPAGAGALEMALGKAGLAEPGWASLYALSRGGKGKSGVFIAKTGYDSGLWRRLGDLAIHQARGLVGQLASDWRFEASSELTHRLLRSYSLRGLAYARCGAAFDPECPRDEIALDGLMIYADSALSFAIQSHHYGPSEAAIRAYRAAGKFLEPFVGRLERPADLPRLAAKEEARRWGRSLADGYDRLARKFRECGVNSRAEVYRRTAEMCRL